MQATRSSTGSVKSLPTPRKSRAISVSLDWDNIIKSGTRISKIRHLLDQEAPKTTVFTCTGSTYVGTWNALNMSGHGKYTLPFGVVYDGEMSDGMFHGEGTLTYPNFSQKVKGVWDKGRLITFQYQFLDGLSYTDPWEYCQYPDRRFFIEYFNGLQPAGQENLTNYQPTRKIDEGCYDVGDGFYNPVKRCVTMPEDPTVILRTHTGHDEEEEVSDIADDNRITRMSNKNEHRWILQHCRKAWDEATGYRPDLYEMWLSGRREEMTEFEKISDEGGTYFSGETAAREEDEEGMISSVIL